MTTSLVANLSQWSGLPIPDVEHIVSTAPRRYKVFLIPKRRGGVREIAQPSRELKILQNLVVRRVLHLLPVHDAAHGYVKGKGIRTNAAAHASSNYMLKMDLRDFFPSIRPIDLGRHLKRNDAAHLSDEERRQLYRLVFWKPKGARSARLCIGAPSSPFLSNTLMFDLDTTIQSFALERGVTYTRYADDMAFSCMEKGILTEIQRLVCKEVESSKSPKLCINQDKTVHISRGQRRMLTGVILSATCDLSLGRERKRLIRSMAHKHSLGLLENLEVLKLNGLLAFAQDIEPAFAEGIRRRYQW